MGTNIILTGIYSKCIKGKNIQDTSKVKIRCAMHHKQINSIGVLPVKTNDIFSVLCNIEKILNGFKTLQISSKNFWG